MVTRYGEALGQVLEALLDEASPVNSAPVASPMVNGNESTRSAELIEQIVILESKLAKATPDTQDAEDVTKYYNPLTLDEIQDLLPEISIEYLITYLAPMKYKPSKLIVGSPSYLTALSAILKDTDAQTLQAYLVWKTVQNYAYEVDDEALKPLWRFNNELQGKDPDASEERWRTCIKVADSGLGNPISFLYWIFVLTPIPQDGFLANSLWKKHSLKTLKILAIAS